MKEKIINVYEHKDEYYISGFDYSELFNVSMGIDSKTHYYKINIQELRNIVKSNQISYRPMDDRRKFLISEKFYSEEEDRLNRIRKCSNSELKEWRNNLMQDIMNGYADSGLLVDIDKEILKRNKQNGENSELRRELIIPLKILADELKKSDFDLNLVGEQIEKLNSIWEDKKEMQYNKRGK